METTSKPRTVRVSESPEPDVAQLFVYGIFLDEDNREHYGMTNPRYDTVQGFITVGGSIVQAVPSTTFGASLTGLVVDIPTENLHRVDLLEMGYDRIKVETNSGVDAFMYSTMGIRDNYSTVMRKFYEPETEEEQEYLAL